MRKYYLEIESYGDDNSISSVEIIDQRTKNRRERFAKTLKNLRLEFFIISDDIFRLLSIVQALNEASSKLMRLEIKKLHTENWTKIKGGKSGKKNHRKS